MGKGMKGSVNARELQAVKREQMCRQKAKVSKDVASAYVLHPCYVPGPYFRWAEDQTKQQNEANRTGDNIVDIQTEEMYKRVVPDFILHQDHRK